MPKITTWPSGYLTLVNCSPKQVAPDEAGPKSKRRLAVHHRRLSNHCHMDDVDSHQGPPGSPFQVGHTMEIVGLDGEDEMMGIIVEAKEKGQIGHLPLADLEVKSKTDKNYWPVREYVMWFGNR